MRTLYLLIISAAVLGLGACTSSASREREAFSNAHWQHLADALEHQPAANTKAEQQPESRLSGKLKLDELIRLSELHSPRLAAAYEKWRGSVRGITAATALPDATFTYTEFIRSIETRLGPIERRFMLQQMVPNPGKLVAREEQAASGAAAMRSNFEATRLGLRESLVVAFVDLQALDERLRILDRLVEILASIELVVEARVTASLAPQSALLRVQVELERLRSERASLEQRRPALAAALTAIVGAKVAGNATAPSLPRATPGALPEDAKLAALALDHPSVQEQFARAAIAGAKVTETGWMWVPDLMFGFEYQMVGIPDIPASMRPDEYGEDAWAFSIGLTIPWQVHVNLARGDMARAEESAARFMVEQQRLDLQARLAGQQYAYRDAARLIELYDETVLPKARQTLELVQNDFTSDRATLTDVLDAERALLATELSLINARADLLKARARLESIVARDLETIN
jgi:outer membrane protein TolC